MMLCPSLQPKGHFNQGLPKLNKVSGNPDCENSYDGRDLTSHASSLTPAGSLQEDGYQAPKTIRSQRIFDVKTFKKLYLDDITSGAFKVAAFFCLFDIAKAEPKTAAIGVPV